MALTGDRYAGAYEGHTVELVRSNWNKTLKLFIDGERVASESGLFPGRFPLTGTLEHEGVPHAVVAKSIPHRLVFSRDTIAVDGSELPVRHEPPRGLFKAPIKAARAGHLPSVILAGAITLGLLVRLAVTAVVIRTYGLR